MKNIQPSQKNPIYVDLSAYPLTVTSIKELENPLIFPPDLRVSRNIITNYSCMICKELMTNPVITNCACAITVCNNCFLKNNSKCPICRKKTTSSFNQNIKAILSKQEIVCECGLRYYHGSQNEHNVVCKISSFVCRVHNAKLNGPSMILHLRQEHYLQILNFAANI